MGADTSHGKKTFQKRCTGFSEKPMNSLVKTRPKTAYRPMTSKLPDRRHETVLSSQGMRLHASPYSDNAEDVAKSTVFSRLPKRPSQVMKSTNKGDKTMYAKPRIIDAQRAHELRGQSKTQNKTKIGNFMVSCNSISCKIVSSYNA